MDKKWLEAVSKLQTYEISPYEINKSIIEFAKILVELCRTTSMEDIKEACKEWFENNKDVLGPQDHRSMSTLADKIPMEKVDKLDQPTLDFGNSEHVV